MLSKKTLIGSSRNWWLKSCTNFNPGGVCGPGALKFEASRSKANHNELALLSDGKAEKGVVAFCDGYMRRQCVRPSDKPDQKVD